MRLAELAGQHYKQQSFLLSKDILPADGFNAQNKAVLQEMYPQKSKISGTLKIFKWNQKRAIYIADKYQTLA